MVLNFDHFILKGSDQILLANRTSIRVSRVKVSELQARFRSDVLVVKDMGGLNLPCLNHKHQEE